MAELTSQPTSIQSVYGWHANSLLHVNRRYQRKLVWTLEEKQKLVESVLRKYPIPAILLAEQEGSDGGYEIIDGLQRLNAIISFIEGAFPTSEGRYFDISAFPTAKKQWDEDKFRPHSQKVLIDGGEVTTLLDYSMSFSIMRRASDREVDDVFDRINSYGHRLSDQERRQSGIQNEFSDLVRSLACKVRGDNSPSVMPLSMMPEVSVDLPMMKHGYDVKADRVFWCEQGILRATDLRDSMDEQCIADIAGSIISGSILERSKDSLDRLYERDSEESRHVISALQVYGAEKFEDEFYYCIDQISAICEAGGKEKLRNLIFEDRNTNAFPAVFAVIFIALHEIFVSEKMSVQNYEGLKKSLNNLTRRIETSRKATAADERRRNVDTIKGLISGNFVESDPSKNIYADHSSLDIDDYIRRSSMELSNFELKQGILNLGGDRAVNKDLLDKICATICAIANNGPNRSGRVVIGVSDKPEDTDKIREIDEIQTREIGERSVVGVNREASVLGISLEDYHTVIRYHIENSCLSEPLKGNVLSTIDFNSYYGLGVVVISVPPQREPSFFGEKMYWRDGDNTKIAEAPKKIADIGRRF